MSNRYSYSFPTNIRFGVGVVDELNKHLIHQGIKAPLFVTDPVVGNLQFFGEIFEKLKKDLPKTTVFCDIHKNPVKGDVLAGREAYLSGDCDAIIGIGGGAGMDVARAIALAINNTRELFDYDDLEGGSVYVTEAIPYFVCVPTTSGTGSEVGRSAIISEDESKRKRILFHPTLLAKQVFADPSLTFELPPAVTAATGMDALTHNMESYLVDTFHPMADGIALEAMKLIARSMEKATNNPDPDSRSDMMLASLMGAVAFQKGLGIVHSLAHPLSTLLDTHHGLANAIMLPYGMAFNVPGQETKFNAMAAALGCDEHSADAVISWLRDLNGKIGISSELSSVGVKSEHIETLSDLAVKDFCHPSNPIPVKREDFKRIYEQAL